MDDPHLARPRWEVGLRFALAGVLIVLLCAGATAAVTVRTANHIANEVFPRLNQIHTPKGLVASIYTGGPKTFLILGSDKRSGSKNAEEREAGAHSDTILLVRFDPEQEQTSVLSIPRDLLVSIKMPNGALMYPEKINAAYTFGSMLPGHDEGANLAAETIKEVLPGLQLNGIIDVTFAGFIRVVDSLGCVYVNVDHRYFNENIGTPETDYTNINLQPGYQKLCYENALAYVRYRHDDSDFVRVARQQDFLRDLREQASPELDQIDQVAREVGDAISTNFAPSASVLLELAKLIGFSQGQPLRQVKFKTENVNYMLGGASYVTSSPELEQATLREFLYGHQHLRSLGASAGASSSDSADTTGTGSSRPSRSSGSGSGPSDASGASAHGRVFTRRHPAARRPPALTPAEEGLYPTASSVQRAALSAAPQVPFPLLYPRLQTGPALQEGVRPYALRDRQGNLHHAYTIVFQQSDGGYYDIEGTDWLDPPIIDDPQETRRVGRRTYLIFADGAHIHMVAWREHHVLYWVINTLLEELSNQQMLTIADSTQPLR